MTHESGWERQQLGTLWPAGTFVGELRTSRYGNLRSESGTTHSRARLHSVGMRHAGPVLRTSLVLARSRTASGGHTQHSLLLLVPAVTSARPTLFPARAGLERRLPPAQKALAFGRPLSSSGARTPARERLRNQDPVRVCHPRSAPVARTLIMHQPLQLSTTTSATISSPTTVIGVSQLAE